MVGLTPALVKKFNKIISISYFPILFKKYGATLLPGPDAFTGKLGGNEFTFKANKNICKFCSQMNLYISDVQKYFIIRHKCGESREPFATFLGHNQTPSCLTQFWTLKIHPGPSLISFIQDFIWKYKWKLKNVNLYQKS